MTTPGRNKATTLTGWGMVLSGAAAVTASLRGVSPYPPFLPELALAGLTVLFAAAWVVTSYRSTTRDPLGKPYRETRRPNPVLPYLFAFGVPLAALAAFMTAFTVSGPYGRETERLERAGYDRFQVSVVRLAGRPAFHPGDEDRAPYYLTDLTLRIPYADGPREVTVPGMYTRHRAPSPGQKVDVYFAPRDPGTGVTEDGDRDRHRRRSILVLVLVCPFLLAVAIAMRWQMDVEALHRLRRFRPVVHLPALAILLTGLILLLPKALEFDVAGFDRLPAVLASLTPFLAQTWVALRRR
ncbi:DUF3592 domain-containing protein [Streptomyces sp. NPDC058667]|uniref:DUF3592 domain-containing protein n=1 Tax=Streptomyces sp. NPDC058667 TaxID=3346588 RepID=UPI00364BDC49